MLELGSVYVSVKSFTAHYTVTAVLQLILWWRVLLPMPT